MAANEATQNQELLDSDSYRDGIFSFLVFVVAVAGILCAVWIVDGTWGDDEWVAIGAAAAVIQAFGVCVGVGYGWLQVRGFRQESHDQRVRSVVDETAELTFRLSRQARTVVERANGCLLFSQTILQRIDGHNPPKKFPDFVTEGFKERRRAFDASATEFEESLDRFSLQLRKLGIRELHNSSFEVLELHLIDVQIFLPSFVDEITKISPAEIREAGANLVKGTDKFKSLIEGIANDYAPRVRAF